jgi:hypothetical protein
MSCIVFRWAQNRRNDVAPCGGWTPVFDSVKRLCSVCVHADVTNQIVAFINKGLSNSYFKYVILDHPVVHDPYIYSVS